MQIGSFGTAVTVANPVTVNGGTLAGVDAGGGASSFNGPITLGPATTATLRATSNFNITAAIGGAGGLNKTGLGTLTVSAASNYGGDTTVSAGTLSYTVPSSFADASAVRLATGAVLNLNAEGTDTIGTFYIDGIPQDSGTWGAIGSGADHETALITGPGLLDASSGGAPFAVWIDSFFPGESDPAIIGLIADPDKDGSDNFTEFAFDGAPDDGADHAKVYVFTADSDFDGDSDKELILTAAIRTSTPAFGNGSPTTSTSTTDGITYSIEGSTTLVDFLESVNAVPTAITTGLPAPSGADYSYRSFRLGGSNGLPGKGFLRARATAP
jgi:autotransporter-associated beta strand protein